MKVYKFGGASVKDAAGVRNVAEILHDYEMTPLVVVISAMGKTTNALEEVLSIYWSGENFNARLDDVKLYHTQIMKELFPNKNMGIWREIDMIFDEIAHKLRSQTSRNYDYVYDQVISYGEILSTKIVSEYLTISGYEHIWQDAREIIFTDHLYREARVDFEKTNEAIQTTLLPLLKNKTVVTQGFIASTGENADHAIITTTLGREGSDYTASILAAAIDADELVIWKDVEGILNADPHRFSGTIKFDSLTYQEAVEMTYYGASVLHPKTIKPVENKNITLHVKSFLNPLAKGTYISSQGKATTDVPIIILKENQLLISLSTKDLSFMAEENIRRIFEEVVRFGIKVNTMQNSAISFVISVDDMGQKVQQFEKALADDFTVSQIGDLQLLTLKHANEDIINQLLGDKNILLEMRTHKTFQFVIDKGF
ncbi:MAG: aspartate kinase [Bacteroidia bacterium]